MRCLASWEQIYILSGDKKSVLQQTDVQLCESCFPIFKTSPQWTGVDADRSPRTCLLWVGQIELGKDQANPSGSICRIRHCSPCLPYLIDISLFLRPHQIGTHIRNTFLKQDFCTLDYALSPGTYLRRDPGQLYPSYESSPKSVDLLIHWNSLTILAWSY